VRAAFNVIQPLVPDWKLPFEIRLLEAARARGESGSKSKTNSADAPVGPAASRDRLRVDPCFIVSSPGGHAIFAYVPVVA
jgi:hypothetical protein